MRSLVFILLLLSVPALAQPVSLTDDTAATEPVSAQLSPQSLGVGDGFGGMI
ncbi:MAG: hypothetical protein GWN07_34675, partial [Actinobacteria bacterium]|nr:hypothetical protein [Actinomycetota bacterium]NIS35967.1 hypothetical protein [Actinomycetota bacterium]NIU71418.1 hypothetical protein [Actinomycetota bacterium]NIW32459.1 hypothetical protein [Actinomycetota bacterium]NIX24673.1 hypothetical protein [Actinomycetota bacterium]